MTEYSHPPPLAGGGKNSRQRIFGGWRNAAHHRPFATPRDRFALAPPPQAAGGKKTFPFPLSREWELGGAKIFFRFLSISSLLCFNVFAYEFPVIPLRGCRSIQYPQGKGRRYQSQERCISNARRGRRNSSTKGKHNENENVACRLRARCRWLRLASGRNAAGLRFGCRLQKPLLRGVGDGSKKNQRPTRRVV